MRKLAVTGLLLLAAGLGGCASAQRDDCGRLAAMRELPFKGEPVSDAAYHAVLSEASGDPTVLVACVDDTTPMADPRKAPSYSGFVVGDVAVMILAEVSGIEIEEVLPSEARAKWGEQGIYAYFEFVSDDANRFWLKAEWARRIRQRGR